MTSHGDLNNREKEKLKRGIKMKTERDCRFSRLYTLDYVDE